MHAHSIAFPEVALPAVVRVSTLPSAVRYVLRCSLSTVIATNEFVFLFTRRVDDADSKLCVRPGPNFEFHMR